MTGVGRRAVGVAAACALVVAVLGGITTDIGPWYAGLKRPPWQPPDFLFGPVWTLIYSLCAISAAQSWSALHESRPRQTLLVLWSANAFLNVFWSLLFFRLRRPDWAQFEVPFLWLSIAVLAVWSWRVRPLAGALLLPYLAWVSFAAVLNNAVVRLNAPFAGL